jgi:acyl-CoA synthetase (AMP-forming)/AMP-acid ligase II
VQLYGSSEHPAAVSSLGKEEHRPGPDGDESHLASAGRVVPGVEVMIVDRQGRRVPGGRDGEIWIRSRAICLGYLHAPDKTAAEFTDGFWKSGDFGRIDANGYLHVLDRVKDTILCDDCNVYPSRVEAAISAHPKVMMAAAVGIDDPLRGESVHVEVVLRPGESVAVEELQAFVAARLTGEDLPTTIGIASSLPLTPVGKVMRRVVREACNQRAGRA